MGFHIQSTESKHHPSEILLATIRKDLIPGSCSLFFCQRHLYLTGDRDDLWVVFRDVPQLCDDFRCLVDSFVVGKPTGTLHQERYRCEKIQGEDALHGDRPAPLE